MWYIRTEPIAYEPSKVFSDFYVGLLKIAFFAISELVYSMMAAILVSDSDVHYELDITLQFVIVDRVRIVVVDPAVLLYGKAIQFRFVSLLDPHSDGRHPAILVQVDDSMVLGNVVIDPNLGSGRISLSEQHGNEALKSESPEKKYGNDRQKTSALRPHLGCVLLLIFLLVVPVDEHLHWRFKHVD